MTSAARSRVGGFVATSDGSDPLHDLAGTPPGRIALRFLMGVITSLFFLLTLAYLMRAQFNDWESLAGLPWRPLSNPVSLWINTAILLASSIALQFASFAARSGNRPALRAALAVGGALAIAFIGGQLVVWEQLRAAGYYVASNPANGFFYLITGLHGVHLLGGLIGWLGAVRRAWSSADDTRVRVSVQLCTTYWHFLFVLWLAMFGLVSSSPETINMLAALCGLR
jgi:cytochrome c oxidase subunit 3